MRPDMAKVVTERPRRGHAERSVKTGAKLDPANFHGAGAPEWCAELFDLDSIDTGRQRTKASRLGQCRDRKAAGDCHKEFSDLLGPLRGYLRKQVGRPWNAVYSELSATLDKRSLTGRHIWTHIWQEVTAKCYIGVSGRIWKIGKYGSGVLEVGGLYVHPVNGLLCWKPERRYRWTPKVDPNLKVLDDGRQLQRIRGCWFLCRYGQVDRWMPEKQLSYGRIIPGHFETETVLQSKKQLNKKELAEYGLRNEQSA